MKKTYGQNDYNYCDRDKRIIFVVFHGITPVIIGSFLL